MGIFHYNDPNEIESITIHTYDGVGFGGNVMEKTFYFQRIPGHPEAANDYVSIRGQAASSVGKRDFFWQWRCNLVNGEYSGDHWGPRTHHWYYTLLDVPKSPSSVPRTDILDYACAWANGQSTESSICDYILSNGFNAHYTWEYNCHRLSSDFVRLVTSLGISASQHWWSSKQQDCGDMDFQKTIPFDPVGIKQGYGAKSWNWHQWAQVSSYQRDPSAAVSIYGNWGVYEDYLFSDYLVLCDGWAANQIGQSLGCEAPIHRYYSSNPTINDWRGPDR